MKRNKLFTYALIMALPVLGGSMVTSCTDSFESLNTSDAQVDPDALPFSSQWLEPMTYCYPPQQNMFQFWTNLTIDWYSGYFMTPNGGFTNCKMAVNRGHSGGMHENYYLHIFNNTRRIIANCEEQEENILAAVMRIVQAYGTLMTTDAYGPLAYTSVIEADDYTTSYYFDSQQTIYTLMLTDLGNAVKTLEAIDATNDATELQNLVSADVWCGGDTDLWIQIANTMRLRMALRLSKRVDEMSAAGIDLKAIAKEAAPNTLAASGGKDILINKGLENEMWLMFNWGDCGFNANLVTLMSGMKDPRQPLYMTMNTDEVLNSGYTKESKDGVTTYYRGSGDSKTAVDASEAVAVPANSGYYGIRFAFDVPNKPNSWSTLSGWIQGDNGSSYSMPLPIFKGAESYFLLAEAELRGWITAQEAGGSVQDLYEKGIRVSIQNEVDYRGPYANLPTAINPSAAADEYLNQTSGQADLDDPIDDDLDHPALNHLGAKWLGGDQEQQLEQIIIQKYLALFPLSTEAWAEQRRTGYPRLFPAIINQGGPTYVDTEEGLRRVIYSSNEYDTNAAELNNSGLKLLNQENTSKTGITGDNGGTRVWWDNANKGNF